MQTRSPLIYWAATLAVCWILGQPLRAAEVRVFILAGQSNMEGKAQNSLLDYQAEAPKTRDLFQHLRQDGQWTVRDDVWIKFLNRHGGLTVGYGSPGRTGLELQFGHVLGNHFEQPVLLIKTAWGGHSLFKNFRPPSAGLPGEEYLKNELEQARQRVQQNNEKRQRNDPLPVMDDIQSLYGQSYRDMLNEVKDTLARYETLFPQLKGASLKLAGLVWFQGWNDMFGDAAPGEYASNLKHFIEDVRKDLDAPNLPVVIGALGQNGSKPAQGGMLTVQQAQLSMNEIPEFQGNVKAIRTDVMADKDAESLIDGWQNHVDEWKKVGSDRAYHYLGSAIWFNRIGQAMAESMIGLLEAPAASKEARWIPLFNGKNLDGWIPKIRHQKAGEDPRRTFRVEDGVIKVVYDQYETFDETFGHLFYKTPYSHYRLRVEYRFTGEQLKGGPGWAYRNSGLMLHGQAPETMTLDQDFPVSLEAQLLGGNGKDSRTTANLCTPGTHVVMGERLIKQHCINSSSKTYHGDQWVTVEIEARGHEVIRHSMEGVMVIQYEKPVLDTNDPSARRLVGDKGINLSGGSISLQSESHPVEFRKVELMVLAP